MGLKDLIYSLGDQPGLQMNILTLSDGIVEVWSTYLKLRRIFWIKHM